MSRKNILFGRAKNDSKTLSRLAAVFPKFVIEVPHNYKDTITTSVTVTKMNLRGYVGFLPCMRLSVFFCMLTPDHEAYIKAMLQYKCTENITFNNRLKKQFPLDILLKGATYASAAFKSKLFDINERQALCKKYCTATPDVTAGWIKRFNTDYPTLESIHLQLFGDIN